MTTDETQREPRTLLLTGVTGILGAAIKSRVVVSFQQHPEWGAIRISGASRSYGLDLRDGAFDHASFDTVIHCAATPYHDVKRLGELTALSNDIECTLAALRTGYRRRDPVKPPHFVLLSSALVYEQALGIEWEEEGRPVRKIPEQDTDDIAPPTSSIGLAKLLSERAVRAWHKQTGGTYTIWRLGNIISPAERHDLPGHLIVNLYRQMFEERRPEIELGDGSVTRAFTWVGDVARVIVEALYGEHKSRPPNQIYNLGSSEPVTITELASELLRQGREAGRLPEDYRPAFRYGSTAGFGDVRVPSNAKLHCDLGEISWTPLAEAVRMFVRGKSGDQAEQSAKPMLVEERA